MLPLHNRLMSPEIFESYLIDFYAGSLFFIAIHWLQQYIINGLFSLIDTLFYNKNVKIYTTSISNAEKVKKVMEFSVLVCFCEKMKQIFSSRNVRFHFIQKYSDLNKKFSSLLKKTQNHKLILDAWTKNFLTPLSDSKCTMNPNTM